MSIRKRLPMGVTTFQPQTGTALFVPGELLQRDARGEWFTIPHGLYDLGPQLLRDAANRLQWRVRAVEFLEAFVDDEHKPIIGGTFNGGPVIGANQDVWDGLRQLGGNRFVKHGAPFDSVDHYFHTIAKSIPLSFGNPTLVPTQGSNRTRATPEEALMQIVWRAEDATWMIEYPQLKVNPMSAVPAFLQGQELDRPAACYVVGQGARGLSRTERLLPKDLKSITVVVPPGTLGRLVIPALRASGHLLCRRPGDESILESGVRLPFMVCEISNSAGQVLRLAEAQVTDWLRLTKDHQVISIDEEPVSISADFVSDRFPISDGPAFGNGNSIISEFPVAPCTRNTRDRNNVKA